MRQDFEDVAKWYRLISNDAINVLVPFDIDTFRLLVSEARNQGLSARWIRAARAHLVNVYRPTRADHPIWTHLEPVGLPKGGSSADWFFCRDEEQVYDREVLGLHLPNEMAWIIA